MSHTSRPTDAGQDLLSQVLLSVLAGPGTSAARPTTDGQPVEKNGASAGLGGSASSRRQQAGALRTLANMLDPTETATASAASAETVEMDSLPAVKNERAVPPPGPSGEGTLHLTPQQLDEVVQRHVRDQVRRLWRYQLLGWFLSILVTTLINWTYISTNASELWYAGTEGWGIEKFVQLEQRHQDLQAQIRERERELRSMEEQRKVRPDDTELQDRVGATLSQLNLLRAEERQVKDTMDGYRLRYRRK